MTIRNNAGRLEVTLSREEYADYATFCNEYMQEEYHYDVTEILSACDDYITINEDMLSNYKTINEQGFYMYADDFWYLIRKAVDEVGVHVKLNLKGD